MQAIGFGLDEHDYHVAASGLHWRPRDHGSPAGRPFVLIVAATIRRPYIRDLSAAVSANRYLLSQHLCLFLLEWRAAEPDRASAGLGEYAGRAIPGCLEKMAGEVGGERPFLFGRSAAHSQPSPWRSIPRAFAASCCWEGCCF